MAEIKWIKLTTDMFDNRKIKHLRKLPEGNNIVLIWVMLLTMAGRCNANGMIFLTENIPYTPKMLADELDFEESTVQLALITLEQLNMIALNNGFYSIAGWEEYQNIEGMEKIREQNRLRQAKYKQKQKQLQGNVTDNVTVTQGNATDIEEDKEIEGEEENVKIDIIDKIDKSENSLFKPSALTNELIEAGYISENDICIDQYNAILQELTNSYSLEIVRSCLWYFIKRFKAQPKDENGNEIENKVAYFRTALVSGAERLERDNNKLTNGIGAWLYSS